MPLWLSLPVYPKQTLQQTLYVQKHENNTPPNKNASLVINLGYHLNIILVYDISYCAVGSRHTVIKLQVGRKPDPRSASRSTFVIRTTQRHVVIAWHVVISHSAEQSRHHHVVPPATKRDYATNSPTMPELFWTPDLESCRNKLPEAAERHSRMMNFPITWNSCPENGGQDRSSRGFRLCGLLVYLRCPFHRWW